MSKNIRKRRSKWNGDAMKEAARALKEKKKIVISPSG
jgi:hypothetical protein